MDSQGAQRFNFSSLQVLGGSFWVVGAVGLVLAVCVFRITADAGKEPSTAAYDGQPNERKFIIQNSEAAQKLRQLGKSTVPGMIATLHQNIMLRTDSLASRLMEESRDPSIHPETEREAFVRLGTDLCEDELRFREQRRQFTRQGLSTYLNISLEDIHEDDIPVVAICNSGGGVRAMIASAAFYQAAQKSNLLDCVTYSAAISGSTWFQTLFYTSFANQSVDWVLSHLKRRLTTHIAFPPELLRLLTTPPYDKYLLAGECERRYTPSTADPTLVELYGLMLAARLLVDEAEANTLDPQDMKLSGQRRFIDDGSNPMPIYSAVRHEIPGAEAPSTNINSQAALAKSSVENIMAKKDEFGHWFQWFDFTPYELYSEDLNAGIPTWATGHTFSNGKSVRSDGITHVPEIRLSMLMGVWASAFCATLSHYWQELLPLISTFAANSGLGEFMAKQDDAMVKVHPILPASIPNFTIGMSDRLPASVRSQGLQNVKTIELMDAGVDNNLPLIPLLRPERSVDMIIAVDSSLRIEKYDYLGAIKSYVEKRNIRGWPRHAGWGVRNATNITQKLTSSSVTPGSTWVGTTAPKDPSGGEDLVETSEDGVEIDSPDAGLVVTYFPLIRNTRVEGVDPQNSGFLGTYNFIYTPENVDKLISIAQENFSDGEESVKRAIRAIYERKKKQRLLEQSTCRP